MKITVYSTGPTCLRCHMTKRALKEASLPFAEVDVRDDAKAASFVKNEPGPRRGARCCRRDLR
ncbi:glutaredoxin family protein [Demequina litorisediminis]|uniref:Glutaredoxin domain-containing protein n=1 Tax=Demequina litorisediminis TaxID=1849022 RepID=A0ABQ6IIV5_9MICO|nr:hypothetical protein GCM10025876_39840 [Demequina litorisediminis]GMA37840.1 hypothetical protein GCM10025876_40440 [Demequina litorisediminis]GMA37900.1 hypothetical protein GCM10025876_41040 [Demequina litorisediminis]